MTDLCLLAVCGAPLAARASNIAAELVRAGWRIRLAVTPTAAVWIDHGDLEAAANAPIRAEHRAPGTLSDKERPVAAVIAPATFNTIGKLAAGIADTYAHSALCEVIGEGTPVVAVPMVNDKLWGHPAWADNTRRLTAAGVSWLSLVDGAIGHPVPVRSGTGNDVIESFDPTWITRSLAHLRNA